MARQAVLFVLHPANQEQHLKLDRFMKPETRLSCPIETTTNQNEPAPTQTSETSPKTAAVNAHEKKKDSGDVAN